MELTGKIVDEKLIHETEEYYKRLDESMSFLIGKYFAIIKTNFGESFALKKIKKFYGKIIDVEFRRDYDSFNQKYYGKLILYYFNLKNEKCSQTIKFDHLSTMDRRKIIYGDDLDSVKLEMECTDV